MNETDAASQTPNDVDLRSTTTAPTSPARGGEERLREIQNHVDVWRELAAANTPNMSNVIPYALELFDELLAVTRERDKAKSTSELHRRTVDRYLPCPDHRDKAVAGTCYMCAAERADRMGTLARCYGFRSALGPNHVEDGLCEQRECARCWRKRAEMYQSDAKSLSVELSSERDRRVAAQEALQGIAPTAALSRLLTTVDREWPQLVRLAEAQHYNGNGAQYFTSNHASIVDHFTALFAELRSAAGAR